MAPRVISALDVRSNDDGDLVVTKGDGYDVREKAEGGAVRNLFALNAALRSEERTDVKVYWGYIRLLQHALFKLPKDETGTLFRGIKVTWIPLATLQAQLLQLAASADAAAEIWWGFSSTSTSLPAVEGFLGHDGPRVIFTVDGGSSARDVRRYSHF